MEGLSDTVKKICRTCLTSEVHQRLVPFTEQSLLKVLDECLSIKISSNDQLICEICRQFLIDLDFFKRRCVENEKILSSRHHAEIKNEIVSSYSNDIDDHIETLDEKTEYIKNENAKKTDSKKTAGVEAKNHFNTKTVRLFTCSLCETIRKYPDKQQLRKHILGMHRPCNFTCRNCKISFDVKSALVHHVERAHTNKTDVECGSCSLKFLCEEEKAVHVASIHQNAECPICRLSFTSTVRARIHLQQHINSGIDLSKYCIDIETGTNEVSEQDEKEYPFPCSHCPYRYKSKQSLYRHKRIHQREIVARCPVCHEDFFDSSFLVNHIREIHQTYKETIVCEKCNGHFFTVEQLNEHILSKHRTKDNSCPICGKKTAKLKRHINSIHSSINSLQCQVCQKTYSGKESLRKHMERHERNDANKTICNICGGKFWNVQRHVRIMHSSDVYQKRFTCRFCKMMFEQMTVLKSHQLTAHAEERAIAVMKVKCNECGRNFLTNRHLASHKKNFHSSHRPFPCSVCNRRFKARHPLLLHMRKHTDERPYPCEQCGKKFRRISTLNDHRRIHGKAMLLACLVCARKFRKVSALKIHEKTIHAPKMD